MKTRRPGFPSGAPMLYDLFTIAVVGLIAYAVWRMTRPRHGITIVLDRDGVRHCEGLPKAHEGNVIDFFRRHIAADGKLTIHAAREPNGRLHLKFRGPVDPGTRQQIRNFLTSVML